MSRFSLPQLQQFSARRAEVVAGRDERRPQTIIEVAVSRVFDRQKSLTFSYGPHFPDLAGKSLQNVFDRLAELGYPTAHDAETKTVTVSWDNGK